MNISVIVVIAVAAYMFNVLIYFLFHIVTHFNNCEIPSNTFLEKII